MEKNTPLENNILAVFAIIAALTMTFKIISLEQPLISTIEGISNWIGVACIIVAGTLKRTHPAISTILHRGGMALLFCAVLFGLWSCAA